jgi:hypothetical protein
MPALVEGGKGNALFFEKLGFTKGMAQKIHEKAP